MTSQKKSGEKGYRLEELLRAYFLRAGFFVVRGVPFQHAGEDLTDIDLWLYEKPTGTSRRRQIVDAKSKTKPKAVERLLWTKGLVQLLGVDGGYVATTNSRVALRSIAKKLAMGVLDGGDISRLNKSEKIAFPDRISEEALLEKFTALDKARRTKEVQKSYHDVKHSLIENFGTGTLNRSLELFGLLARELTSVHPDSEAADAFLRLAYFSAAIAALSMDFVALDLSFRGADERRNALINAIRVGNIDEAAGLEKVRVAVALLRSYAPNGDAVAATVESAMQRDMKSIPAEIVADYVVKLPKMDILFQIARNLEHGCFMQSVPSFDALGVDEKSFIGALLDFCGISRARFVSSWSGKKTKGDARGVEIFWPD